MQVPLKITFRDVPKTEAIEALVREKAAKLERVCDAIISCQIAIERPHRHEKTGNPYRVRIAMTVPPGQRSWCSRMTWERASSRGGARREKKRSDNRGVSRGNIRDFPLKIEGSPNSHERGHSV